MCEGYRLAKRGVARTCLTILVAASVLCSLHSCAAHHHCRPRGLFVAALHSQSARVPCGFGRKFLFGGSMWNPRFQTALESTGEQREDVPQSTGEPQQDVVLPETLHEAAEDIIGQLLVRYRQECVPGHELPPYLPKMLWTNLGGHLKRHEQGGAELPADKWISLRLDGCHWGSLTKQLVELGLIQPVFNSDIAEAMMACCRAIMSEFGGVLGYTHSDELTVLIPPSDGERAHGHSAQFWISTAASIATAVFNRRLEIMAANAGVNMSSLAVAYFDCRVGVFTRADDALALVLWRSNDCSVNSASDAIKFCGASKAVKQLNTLQKLAYLHSRGLLPLRRHQAFGSLFVKCAATEVLLEDGSDSADPQHCIVLLNSGAGDLPQHVQNLLKLGPLLPGKANDEDPERSIPVQELIPWPPSPEHVWPYGRPCCVK